MKEEHFLQRHQEEWQILEDYCKTIQKHGSRQLTSQEAKNFLTLFKAASHHLAYANTHYARSQTIHYLNNLVSQCNTYVYTHDKVHLGKVFTSFFTDYAKLCKKYRSYILLSFGIFFLGGLISFLMVYFAPDQFATLFVDANFVEGISENGYSHSAEGWNYPLMSSFIMTNNILVSLKAFVYGITLGILTLYILFMNGTMLGGLSALFYLYGDPVKYWSLILPHGIFELTAIFIAGGAGLILAKSLLVPGAYTRLHSLIKGAKEALSLMGGVVILLIFAGIIEGFFTPLPLHELIKLAFALLTAVLLILFFMLPYFKKNS